MNVLRKLRRQRKALDLQLFVKNFMERVAAWSVEPILCNNCGLCCKVIYPRMYQCDIDIEPKLKQCGKDGDAIELPCMFLTKDNKCSIYETRPIACRTFLCSRWARKCLEIRYQTGIEILILLLEMIRVKMPVVNILGWLMAIDVDRMPKHKGKEPPHTTVSERELNSWTDPNFASNFSNEAEVPVKDVGAFASMVREEKCAICFSSKKYRGEAIAEWLYGVPHLYLTISEKEFCSSFKGRIKQVDLVSDKFLEIINNGRKEEKEV